MNRVKTKDVLLAATVLAGLVLMVKTAQVALTPEFWDWLSLAADLLLQSAGVKVLVVAVALLWCLSLVALAWERMDREHERRAAARREAERIEVEGHARSLRVREEIEEATRHDRGPRTQGGVA